MAQLTRDDILKLARLARLELTEAEVAEYAQELGSILAYVEQLKDVDVSGLEPTNQVTGLNNVTRNDEVLDYGYDVQTLLAGAPAVHASHIKVRRMIG